MVTIFNRKNFLTLVVGDWVSDSEHFILCLILLFFMHLSTLLIRKVDLKILYVCVLWLRFILLWNFMKKVLSTLVMAAFAMASGAAFAASHAGAPMGAPMDAKKMEEMKAACKKADPKMDDKMKAECKAMEAKK